MGVQGRSQQERGPHMSLSRFWMLREPGDDETLMMYAHCTRLTAVADVFADNISRAYGVRTGRCFHLLHMHVVASDRLQGVGSGLLRRIAMRCMLDGIEEIRVDDMSDRCHRARNIYCKHGFEYRVLGSCEMNATPERVLLSACDKI